MHSLIFNLIKFKWNTADQLCTHATSSSGEKSMRCDPHISFMDSVSEDQGNTEILCRIQKQL